MPRRRRQHTAPSPGTDIASGTGAPVQPGDRLCGYRLVRKLGDAKCAEVFLGFSESTAEEPSPSTAAIKVYREPASRDSIQRESEALSRASHPHVVRLVDIATTENGLPCLVMERLARGSLAHLLEMRATLSAGEAVTILTPIAAALDALHASGVVHGAIGAQSVMFRESGAPVLARFGRSSLIAPGQSDAALAMNDGVVADRAALAELCRIVLSRTGVTRALPPASSDAFGEALADELFAVAPPTVVRFTGDATPVASAVPARVGVRAAFAPQAERSEGVLARARQIADAVMAQARTVRRPVWLAAASVIVAIIAAVLLIPADDPVVKAEPQSTVTVEAEEEIVDDPLAALGALLSAREQCIAAVSVLCLDAVDQQGSQAFDADAGLLAGVQNGEEIPDDTVIIASDLALVERLGDTALVSLGPDSKPASVLLVKTEAGWRIRDYLD